VRLLIRASVSGWSAHSPMSSTKASAG
jgi:hypothetical protein